MSCSFARMSYCDRRKFGNVVLWEAEKRTKKLNRFATYTDFIVFIFASSV